MPTFLTSFTFWKYVAIVVACVSAGAWGATQIESGRVASAQAETARVKADLTVETASKNSLQSGLNLCNASVKALKTLSDAATSRADAALADKRAALAQASKTAAQIMALKPGVDLCKSAEALIQENVR